MFTLSDHDTMKARLLRVCDSNHMQTHLYPQLLEVAGKEISGKEAFFHVALAVSRYNSNGSLSPSDKDTLTRVVPDIYRAFSEENPEFEKEAETVLRLWKKITRG